MNRTATLARLTIVILVTAGIFWISASHIIAVAMTHGNPFEAALVYPVAIDGLILVSALTMSAKTGVNKATRHYAKLARYFGFACTIYANAVHSGWTSTDAIIVNLIPALALILMMEVVIASVQLTPATRRNTRRSAADNVTPIRARKAG